MHAPPMWTSTCCGHCFHGPFTMRTVQKVSTTVDSSSLWTLFARPSSVHIRGPPLYLKMFLFYLFRFKTSNNDHIITVNMYDDIDFVCPHYTPGTAAESMHEYYIIYSVSIKYTRRHICKQMLMFASAP